MSLPIEPTAIYTKVIFNYLNVYFREMSLTVLCEVPFLLHAPVFHIPILLAHKNSEKKTGAKWGKFLSQDKENEISILEKCKICLKSTACIHLARILQKSA
jgi:hypothetical protein